MSETLLSASEVRRLLDDEVADWGTQKLVARQIGVSQSYLSDVRLGRRDPGPVIVGYFGLEPVTLYRALAQTQSGDNRNEK